MSTILWSGQDRCYDDKGAAISCLDSGQEGEHRIYAPWPTPRFRAIDNALALDLATELIWPLDACLTDFPLSWNEALALVQQMNHDHTLGRNDWRLPNRREMRSLIDHSRRKPALAKDHPFVKVALGWYWTSTSAAIARPYAWYVHMEGGRMFYGKKSEYCWLWPVSGNSPVLSQTGQERCYNDLGSEVSCQDLGHDASFCSGVSWPDPRFSAVEHGVADQLTGLVWHKTANLVQQSTDWLEALAAVNDLARQTAQPWRLPTINELESLVDASRHTPALPKNHLFSNVQEAYWSSTTSGFKKDWAYALYLHKGAVGVGYKANRAFSVWPVLGP